MAEGQATTQNVRSLSLAFDSVRDAVMVTDSDCKLVFANSTSEMLFGYTQSEMLGEPLSKFFADEELAFTPDKTRSPDNRREEEITAVRKGGKQFQARLSVTSLDDTQVQASQVCVVSDISVPDEDYQQLAQVNMVLAEIGRIISSSLDIDEVYERFAQEVKKIIPFDRIGIGIISPESGMSTRTYLMGLEVPGVQQTILPIADTPADVVVRTRKGLIADTRDLFEMAERLPVAKYFLQAGIKSFLVVPLVSKNQVIAVLYVHSTTPDAYSRGDLTLAQRVADQIAGAIANSQLFAERNRAQEALRESEEKWRSLVENAADPIYVINEQGRIVDANQQALSTLGYSREKLLTMSAWNIAEGSSPSKYAERLRRMIAEGPITAESTHRRNDGTTFPVEIHSNLIESGAERYELVLTRDVTERKQAEAALRQQSREREILAEIGRVITSSLDIDEVYEPFARQLRELIHFDRVTITLMNPEANSMDIAYLSGLAQPEYGPGKSFPLPGSIMEAVAQARTGLICPLDDEDRLARTSSILIPAFQAGLRCILAVPLISEDQIFGTLQLGSVSPDAYSQKHIDLAENVGAQIAGAIANSRLHMQRQRLEQQLLQSQKMEAIGQLAGGIAHDFNNMLSAIMSYTHLAITRLGHKGRIYGYLEQVQKSSERAANLTRQLLAFSRRQVTEPRVLDLNDILIDMNGMLRRLIGENIELITIPVPDLGFTKVDPAQMEQVLVNLVVNAQDAMPGGGRLIIETANVNLDQSYASEHPGATPGEHVMVSVTDTGVGMEEETRRHIFEPFFTTKEVGKGTGLGLSICYGIATQNGGHISVESAPNEGTTFKIYLPRVEQPVSPLPMRDEMGYLPGGSETVLLVEDEPSVKSVITHVLQELGYTVLEASNGVQAIEVFDQHPGPDINLLLTDMVMPVLGGKELASRLKEVLPGLKVLYTSGYTDGDTVNESLLEDGSGFMQKPFTPAILARKVRDALSNPGAATTYAKRTTRPLDTASWDN